MSILARGLYRYAQSKCKAPVANTCSPGSTRYQDSLAFPFTQLSDLPCFMHRQCSDSSKGSFCCANNTALGQNTTPCITCDYAYPPSQQAAHRSRMMLRLRLPAAQACCPGVGAQAAHRVT